MQALEIPLNGRNGATPSTGWSLRSPADLPTTQQRERRSPRCSRAGAERVLGLTIKAALLTAQRVLDLLALWRITCGCSHKVYQDEDWWLLAVGAVASTALSAVTFSRHRCALRQNRPYGWGWATFLALLQLAAVVEMIDKLGDGCCWGVQEILGGTFLVVGPGQARALPEMKGSRYGENLMRGLRKLSIASLPMIMLSTSVHLVRISQVLVNSWHCDSACNVEVVALVVGIVCLANACSDVVLYIWVDDVYVKRHKKLVQLHYLIELLARAPILLVFHVALKPRHGSKPLAVLWACDVLADVFLLLLPTLRAWLRGRLSCRHGFSQVSTAVIVAQLLFGVNVTFFDPRDAFLVLNAGFYLVKTLEVIFMMKMLSLRIGQTDFFQWFYQAQLAVTIANAALVWVIVPWSHRAMDAHILRSVEALPRLRALLPGSPGMGSMVGPEAVRRHRSSSVLSHIGSDLPVRDRTLSLELGTVGAPQAAGSKINAAQIGEDSAMRLELLGDILEALCLLSQTQSLRNRPVLARTMVVNILWSLVLPVLGEYDDGRGGLVTLTSLDPERGAVLLQHRLGSQQPRDCHNIPRINEEGDVESSEVQESIALVFHGTAIEVVWEGEGRVFGIFNGRRIHFTDRHQTIWTRRSGPDDGANGVAGVGAQEVLRLVLMQLLLALRWEPTFLGLGPRATSMADKSLAAIDASQRPLLCFVVRYSLAARDLVFISEVYWSLWCLSQDPQDSECGTYDKARWALVTALQGGLEFWDGDRGLRLDNPGGTCPFGATAEGEAFRREALQLLVRHGALWRQTVLLAKLGAEIQGDAAERTRVVRQQLIQQRMEATTHVGSGRVELLLDTEDPYLIDIDVGLQDHMRTSLTDPGTDAFVSLPVDPGVRFLGLNIAGCEILASNSAPLLLSCWKDPDASCSSSSSQAMEAASTEAAESVAVAATQQDQPPQETHDAQKYMVKVGDDLRQDQLVLQLLVLMERVWQERLPPAEHEMLRLAPYRVLAMTPNAGYVKFVPGAVSLSKALYRSRGDLVAWLDASRPRSVPLSEVLNNLCGSVAAYCVATYCLGIGDRHLDNLQITPMGYFFHIDFGFIFGDDPKPFAPRLRLPQPVASALHATQVGHSETSPCETTLLDRCFLLAGRAYVALRRSMPLWVSLLRVTGEAGGAGCQRLRANADAAVAMVRDRLQSHLGVHEEEAAAADFLLILYESTEALYPMLTDKVHQLGQFWK